MKKIITLTSAVLLGLSFTSCAKNNSNEVSSTSVADNIISYPEGYDTTSQGASSYANSGDHLNSKYFAQLDVYNLKSTDTLTILPKFKTYQQRVYMWTCNCTYGFRAFW